MSQALAIEDNKTQGMYEALFDAFRVTLCPEPKTLKGWAQRDALIGRIVRDALVESGRAKAMRAFDWQLPVSPLVLACWTQKAIDRQTVVTARANEMQANGLEDQCRRCADKHESNNGCCVWRNWRQHWDQIHTPAQRWMEV